MFWLNEDKSEKRKKICIVAMTSQNSVSKTHYKEWIFFLNVWMNNILERVKLK